MYKFCFYLGFFPTVIRNVWYAFCIGMAAKPKTDAFGDLLGSGFNPKKPTESKSLKNMKSNQDIANSLDPEKARVMSDI